MTDRRTQLDDASRLGFEAARQICRRHARSFYFASAFLPPAKRSASYAVYGFCRMLDDAIDQVEPAEAALPLQATCCSHPLNQRLDQFLLQLKSIYDGTLELPRPEFRSEAQHALHAFALTARRYEIPMQYFVDLADGCRMDLTISRYATWNALERYCYHVAGVVGLIMSCVFGLQHSDARHHAVQMGNAMQLTNILRDINEDWQRGRIYLPLEDLARFQYSERDLASHIVNDSFRRLMRFEIARARELFREGAEGLCWLAGDGSRLTASAMAVIYSGILDAIERLDYDVYSSRAHLSFVQKLARLPQAWKLARREAGDAMPRAFA